MTITLDEIKDWQYHQQPKKLQISEYPEQKFVCILKMDATDFWHQAGAPFGLPTTTPLQHHPNNEPLLQTQEEQLPNPTVHNNQQLTAKTDHTSTQHQHIDSLEHSEQSYNIGRFETHHHTEHTDSDQISNHHLLFNAAAAAAAAAHLNSTVLQSHNSNSSLMAHIGSVGQLNNSIAIENSNRNPNNNNNIKTKFASQQQHIDPAHTQPEQPYNSDIFKIKHVPMEPLSSTSQQQQQQGPVLQQNKQMDLSGNLTKPMLQGQQSPQHSITPSGGSSTPDIKYNDKLANEIQLQLSRSSSAAAISERTLEECWSTLQRLFMHKSAMQQIQQQIPRVGLGSHGSIGTASMASGGAETKPHQCHQCMKSFSSNHQLVQHIRVHTGEKPYKCSYCDRRFKQLSHVQQHTRLHTGERPYKCHLPDCGRAFIQLSNLQQHLRNHDAQVERAKNRPFHCNICGKGFATESSLRTHTSKQHAALIGGPNATSCPLCHKLFLGTDALMEHMKHVHKEKSLVPSIPAPHEFTENLIGGNTRGIPMNAADTSCTQLSTNSNTNLNDSYLGKRRIANHPCPVCGKHYVNEGSLRKHLACHAETSQLTNSLRMWPCSVCQAVFTHENGLLTHMEHMRMDPKHQFAAQYVLSRAAAEHAAATEHRERDQIFGGTLNTSAACKAVESDELLPIGPSICSNSLCPSPSVNSECSSNGRLSSSSASTQVLSENDSHSHNNNSVSSANYNSSKRNDSCLPSSNQYTIDTELHVANRMSLMAAASAAAAAVAASAGSRAQDDCTTVTAVPGTAAVQAAVVNLAAAMRLSTPAGSSGGLSQPNQQQHIDQHHHQQSTQQSQQHQQHTHLHPVSPLGNQPNQASSSNRNPAITIPHIQSETPSVVMNIMRGSLDTTLGSMHQIEALHHQHHGASMGHQASSYSQHAETADSQQIQSQSQSHNAHHNPEATLRMQQQAEAILRSHREAALRLAASVAATNGANASPPGDIKNEPLQQHNGSKIAQNTFTEGNHQSSDQRLEQTLRLRSDGRILNFPTSDSNQQAIQGHQTEPERS